MINVANHHFVGDGSGGWIKRPGSLKIGFHLIEYDSATQIAEKIVQSSTKTTPQKIVKLKKHLKDYIASYIELKKYLSTPQGNVPVCLDSPKLDNLWHLYLMRGRELIDSIGKEIHICFRLHDKISGINQKKINTLKINLVKIQEKYSGAKNLLEIIKKYESFLNQFIDLRNIDKEHSDTLKSPPYINPDGSYSDGLITFLGTNLNFSEFFNSSYFHILGFVCDVLGCSIPEEAKSSESHR